MLEKIASENKILARLENNEIQITNKVQSLKDQEWIDSWLEFNNEDEAYTHFGIEKSEV